ncbi:MAG: hypothetical protein H7Y89_07365 [Steroidobacteraceae bacterium]|nr:hypothetical protein [Steroidobacteraceae bacterium]
MRRETHRRALLRHHLAQALCCGHSGAFAAFLINKKVFLAGSVITHVIFDPRSTARINTIFVVISGLL